MTSTAHVMQTRIEEIDLEHDKTSRALDKILLNRQPHVADRKKHLMDQLSRLEAERAELCQLLDELYGNS